MTYVSYGPTLRPRQELKTLHFFGLPSKHVKELCTYTGTTKIDVQKEK